MVIHFRAFYIGKSDIHLSSDVTGINSTLQIISAGCFLYLEYIVFEINYTIHLSVNPIAHV